MPGEETRGDGDDKSGDSDGGSEGGDVCGDSGGGVCGTPAACESII